MIEINRTGRVPGRSKLAPGIVATAAWLGLAIGLLEVGVLIFRKDQNHLATIGALRLNRHYPWMIPTAHLAIFGTCGIILEGIARVRPAMRRAAPRFLAVLALLSLLMFLFREVHPIASVLLAAGIAAQLVPRIGRFRPVLAGVVRVSLPVLIAALLLLIVGRHAQFALAAHRANARPKAEGSPNVLLIVLDTVRARSLSLYGYGRETTPRLDRLARSGVKFEQARSTAPWTLPSHASMLTGCWPHELFDHPEAKLSPVAPTLAEFLGSRGYATAGFVANTWYCNAGFGLGRGFDHYEDFYDIFDTSPVEILRHAEIGRRVFALMGDEGTIRTDGRKDADRINADFLAWLSKQQGRPFFAFLNFLDAHAPYIPPARADRHFGLRPTTPADFQLLNTWQKRTTLPTDPREIALARDAYDDCLAYLDDTLGRLFDELDRRGVLGNTLVIVTADHGEEMGEHQLVGHGRSLYGGELHVPLLIAKPGRVPSGRTVPDPVSLRDIPATVVDVLGLGGRSPFPGRSLAPLWSDGPASRRLEPGVVLSEVALREKVSSKTDRPPALRGPMTSIVAEGMTYIRNADGREELYRLADDPGEANDLANTEEARPTLERLRDLADRERDDP